MHCAPCHMVPNILCTHFVSRFFFSSFIRSLHNICTERSLLTQHVSKRVYLFVWRLFCKQIKKQTQLMCHICGFYFSETDFNNCKYNYFECGICVACKTAVFIYVQLFSIVNVHILSFVLDISIVLQKQMNLWSAVFSDFFYHRCLGSTRLLFFSSPSLSSFVTVLLRCHRLQIVQVSVMQVSIVWHFFKVSDCRRFRSADVK